MTLLLALTLAVQLAAPLPGGRLAIVASAGFADGQAPLRYANRDGDRMEAVLRELGGFDRVERLRDPSVQSLRAALDRTEEAAARDSGLQVIFFYSGHADQQGLLIGGERFGFSELRGRLEESHAAVRVALIDACYAGALVQAKGGTPAPAYALNVVTPPRVRGAAIIAAGTSGELAQESSDIEGSYFTHHLLSALRGAGDRDGDGVVTLAETYQYAYGHTLAATLPSIFGPQHPSYDVRLAGTGELALTRPGRGHQALTFPAGDARTYLVSNAAQEVVAEVSAQPQARVRLVLPAGRYRVAARRDRRAWLAEVTLPAEAGDLAVESAGFREVAPAMAFAKGGQPLLRNELAVDVAVTGLGPGVINGTLELGAGYFRRWRSFTVGPHVSYGEHDGTIIGVPFLLRRWATDLFALRRTQLGFSEAQFGLELGLAVIEERTNGRTRLGLGSSVGGLLAFDFPMTRSLALRIVWSAGAELLRVDGQLHMSPQVGASLGVVLRR